MSDATAEKTSQGQSPTAAGRLIATHQLRKMLQVHPVPRRNEKEWERGRQSRSLYGIKRHFSPCPLATEPSYWYHMDSVNSLFWFRDGTPQFSTPAKIMCHFPSPLEMEASTLWVDIKTIQWKQQCDKKMNEDRREWKEPLLRESPS